ncbi:DUF2927 domain-containing protein [Flavilitoribacter nigricans]|uniref:DUF2927 domain-containing protein n=1 Tax=Flavilitoribacter nigricans (strain ATCC 23147 / DSM 23189 / NBRC 102662 / NCIMB 1420 / SS-2) TaxID=1122177 RepID=A0A2D0NI66_FLAN2|nr:DUF2927 domain-containing protein [Flavilitoribacter nigricans]PHN07859.1 hypothetical protein CRP01_03665 [Flavilitoribacter nigricans DSM 23189 = NBRC 102662]
MKNYLLLLISLAFLATSCTKDIVTPDPSELTAYELEVIDYFKEIALGFEFGGASEITRKWRDTMKIYVGGSPSSDLLNELEEIRTEINSLVSDGFAMEVVADSAQSNFYIFLGSADEYVERYPSQAGNVTSNWGLFNVFWNGSSEINRGHMYVDLDRADPPAQRHLLREELTQSLGLAKDSDRYTESIFQASWTTTNEYAMIDRDLIRLLYHPDMPIGLDEMQTDAVLRDILSME